MTLTEHAAPDLAQVKQRQQQMWASGDFHAVATLIQPVADLLCEAVDLQAGWRVIDVACGSGNAAIAAARCGADAVGIDYVPALLARGRRRGARHARRPRLTRAPGPIGPSRPDRARWPALAKPGPSRRTRLRAPDAQGGTR